MFEEIIEKEHKLIGELEELESKIKKYYMLRSDLKITKEKLEEKKYSLQSYNDESEFLSGTDFPDAL